MLGLQQHHTNYTLITIIQLLCLRARALAHSLHILCIFIIAICTTAKWNKTYARNQTNTPRCIPLCSVHCTHTSSHLPRFHFISEWLQISIAAENWHYANDVQFHCVVDLVARQSDQSNTLSVIILLLCEWNARSKQRNKNRIICVHLPSSQATLCTIFSLLVIYCLRANFWRKKDRMKTTTTTTSTFPPWNYLIFNSWCVLTFFTLKGLFHFEMTGINRNTNNNTNRRKSHSNEWLRQRKEKKSKLNESKS